MKAGEFDEFASRLKLLEEVFGKKFTDELMKAYWQALNDLPLEVVKVGIAHHLRYGKFFPKPVELRRHNDTPRDNVGLSAGARRSPHIAMMELAEKDPGKHGYLKGALELNADNWREFHARDPELADLEYRIAQVARCLAVARPDSPESAEAIRSDRALRAEREVLLRRRNGTEDRLARRAA